MVIYLLTRVKFFPHLGPDLNGNLTIKCFYNLCGFVLCRVSSEKKLSFYNRKCLRDEQACQAFGAMTFASMTLRHLGDVTQRRTDGVT